MICTTFVFGVLGFSDLCTLYCRVLGFYDLRTLYCRVLGFNDLRTRGRLVEEEDAGQADELESDVDALPLATADAWSAVQ